MVTQEELNFTLACRVSGEELVPGREAFECSFAERRDEDAQSSPEPFEDEPEIGAESGEDNVGGFARRPLRKQRPRWHRS